MSIEAASTALGATAILLFAGGALVLAPYLQLAEVAPSPGSRPMTEAEARGRALYVSEGCAYCHSQQPRDPMQAPDGERGWGRPSVPGDYVGDLPHQLGTMRTGPDLHSVGARLPSREWHAVHLYQPRAVSPWSVMPGYPYLFEHKASAVEGDVVVAVPDEWKREPGVVVARAEALDLIAYLQSLDHTAPVLPAVEEAP